MQAANEDVCTDGTPWLITEMCPQADQINLPAGANVAHGQADKPLESMSAAPSEQQELQCSWTRSAVTRLLTISDTVSYSNPIEHDFCWICLLPKTGCGLSHTGHGRVSGLLHQVDA